MSPAKSGLLGGFALNIPNAYDAEVRKGYEEPGVTKLLIACVIIVLAFALFWLSDYFAGSLPLLGGAQTLRVCVVITYAVIVYLCLEHKKFVSTHYRVIAFLLYFIAIQLVCYVAFRSRADDLAAGFTLPELYWSMTTSVTIATVVILGLSRLGWRLTLFITLSGMASAIYLVSTVDPLFGKLNIRLITHLSIVNAVCFMLAFTTEMREKKIILLARNNYEQDKYAQSLKEINDLLESTKREVVVASQAKSAFLANISHEIKTPLHGVVTSLEAIKQMGLPSDSEKILDIALRSGHHLQMVMDDIIDYARLDLNKVKLNLGVVNLKTLLSDVVDVSRSAAFQRNINLKIEDALLLPEHIQVLADKTKISQVLINLISNAIKFTLEGSIKVQIESMPLVNNKARITFRVIDTGIGIPADSISALFRPFQQIDNSDTRQYGGTGLGLAICKMIVNSMSGEINVSSVLGRGSEFWFSLDLSVVLDEAEAPVVIEEVKNEVISPATTATVNMTVASDKVASQLTKVNGYALVVDDHIQMGEVTVQLLRSLGINSAHVGTAREAIERFLSEDFDVVLMDIQMPDLDGIGAVKILRELESNRDLVRTPIIAYTAGYGNDMFSTKLQEAGFDDLYLKPIKVSEFLPVIRKWISIKRGS